MRAFMQGANLRNWLSRPDCPPSIKACKQVVDRAYGHENAESIDGSLAEDIDSATDHRKVQAFPLELTNALAISRGCLRAHYTLRGVVYSRASTHSGNSLVVYHPEGDYSKEIGFASIQYIFKIEGAASWRFAVRRQLPRPVDIMVDPFAKWPDYPACMASSSLADNMEIIDIDWVDGHYSRWVIPEDT